MKENLSLLHMYPDMLDLYGDSGNVEILSYRCRMRGIALDVTAHTIANPVGDLSAYDIIYLGGGADYEQQLLADDLLRYRSQLQTAYKSGVFMLMICGGYQLLGQYYRDANGVKIPGLAIFPYYTIASANKRRRCIGNIVVQTQLDGKPYQVIGFENHGGQTHEVGTPFGRVLCGSGNRFSGKEEGYREENVIATYLHGPLLAKNPALADSIIRYCMTRKKGSAYPLPPLDDSLEEACRAGLLKKLL